MMRYFGWIVATLLLAMCMAGCGRPKDSFTLPPGDADRGVADFVRFRCHDCHRVKGVELPVGEEPNQAVVELGEVEQPRQYSELVTSIINPSHRLAKGYTPELVAREGSSKMPVYNDVMTVTQLTDIVTFLQAHTTVKPHEKTVYPDYYGP